MLVSILFRLIFVAISTMFIMGCSQKVFYKYYDYNPIIVEDVFGGDFDIYIGGYYSTQIINDNETLFKKEPNSLVFRFLFTSNDSGSPEIVTSDLKLIGESDKQVHYFESKGAKSSNVINPDGKKQVQIAYLIKGMPYQNYIVVGNVDFREGDQYKRLVLDHLLTTNYKEQTRSKFLHYLLNR